MPNSHENNELARIETVKKILLQEWDPFCVGDNPNLADEYDPFVPDLVKILQENCSVDQLQKHFIKIEQELQSPTSAGQRLKTATALHNFWSTTQP